ncbi:MAG TPA: LamG domain-containing protein, partial [Thermoplasmatales archaeon]|nr:LamG domain-containing protein [Thermoplasmatales archaeon]HEX08424.1 LamG domain-containing protein [Thermoplasmatales archaeon]
MNRKKPTKAIYIMLIIFILIILNIMFTVTIRGEDTSAWHRFKGYATDNTLKPIRDGVVITAIVVNVNGSTETYTTTVNNSLTGKNYDFYVEDPDADNNGRPIYFYIGNENTSQSVNFTTGGLNVNWSTYYNLTIDDIPKIIDNTPINGTTGDPFTFNITITEYVDSADELTVKVNWTHGSLSGNDTMIPTGGSNVNGFYFETTITLDDCESTLNYTIYVNDTSGNHNSSGPHDVAVIDNDPPQTTLELGSPRYNNFVTTSTPIYLNATDNCNDWFIHYRIWNVTSGWSPWHVGNKNTNITITFTEECTHYIEYYANDTSILNNTGTTHNTTFYVDDTPPISSIGIGNPKNGYSLYFDGSNDYVDCGNDSSLDLTDNFTIEAWINPYSFSFDAGIVSKYQELGHKGYVLRLANAEPYNRINFRGVLGSTLLQAKKWYHVVAVVKNGIAYLYLNGTLDGSGSFGDIVVNEDILTIGVDYLQSPRYFHGLIDDVRIYNKPLTQAEILSNYLGNVVTDGLVSWWKFNEGTGNTAYDSADNNNGTIHGATHISYLTSSTPIWINATDNGTSPCIVGSVDLNVSIYSFQTGNWTYYETHVDNGTASINFTIPEECRHWINITATDDLGNSVYQNTTVHVDNTPPTTTMTIGSPKYVSGGDTYITSSTSITLSAVDGGLCMVGVNHTYYRINGSSWVEYTSPFTISDGGSHTIEWYSVDYLGNMESIRSYTVYVDNTPPTTTLSVGSPRYPSTPYDGCNVTSLTLFTLSASDNPAAHNSSIAFTWYTIDGDYYTGTSFTLSGYGEGSHTITYGSQDNLG